MAYNALKKWTWNYQIWNNVQTKFFLDRSNSLHVQKKPMQKTMKMDTYQIWLAGLHKNHDRGHQPNDG